MLRAAVAATDAHGVTLTATCASGRTLVARVEVAGDGIIRVRLADDLAVRSRSAAALTLVHPQPHPATVTVADGHVRVGAGGVVAEVRLDPWGCASSPPTGGCCWPPTAVRGTSAVGAVRCRSAAPLSTASRPPGTRASWHQATNGSSASARSSRRWTSAASDR
ncbi:hypothetical protein V2I01_37850 [Micromonospora sp. BRA006-A]|nr:hypothetical protein [Micromonospora sp. BRA006-A]